MKAIFIQLKQIGDVLLTTPAVKAFKLQYPHAEIHFLTIAPSDQIFLNSKLVDKVWLLSSKASIFEQIALSFKLRAEKFDVSIDFNANLRGALIMFLAGVKKRLGFDLAGRKIFYTTLAPFPKDLEYSGKHKIGLLSSLGVKSSDYQLVFQDYVPKLRSNKLPNNQIIMAVCPVSRREYKRWPINNFVDLIAKINEAFNVRFVLVGSQAEEPILKDLAAKLDPAIIHSVQSFLNLGQAYSFFESADYLIGNDNGLRHIAIASGLANFAVFGQGHPSSWTAPSTKGLSLTIENKIACKFACVYPKCGLECINDISVADCFKMLMPELGIRFPEAQLRLH